MKSQPLLAIALLFATRLSGIATNDIEKTRNRLELLRGVPTRNEHQDPLERAYVDAYQMLGGNNACGDFFGGSPARLVLDELMIRLRRQTMMDTRIALRMSGMFKLVVDRQNGIEYRIFENCELNNVGAFYRSKTFPSEPLIPHMGSFPPNTREARVLILLHELAHLIKDKNGMWLIPDDGQSTQQSRHNTLTIEARCEQQIRRL